MPKRCLTLFFFLSWIIPPAYGRAPEISAARSLVVEIWSTRSVKTIQITALDGAAAQPTERRVEWTPAGLRGLPSPAQKQLSLSGTYRLQTIGQTPTEEGPEVAAAGVWNIAWRRDGIRVLLTLPSERYVMAALNGEAAADEPLASLKAMAVTIRTYALENANRHAAQGFGLCDSTHCQALRLGRIRPEIERAVHETAGETLWFAGGRTHIYYTQHCGGTSEAASSLWPAERAPYLAGKRSDPYCLRRSSAEWHTRISLDQLTELFRAQGWQTPSPLEALRVTRRSEANRALTLTITGRGAPAALSASSFRFAVDRAYGWNQVRSDWYTTSMSGPFLDISGRGYGHGVGLCQAGAYEMAVEGHSAAEILNFYFPGAIAGVTAFDHGWQQTKAAGWTLLTTHAPETLLAEGNAAWARAQSLTGWAPRSSPTVEELPSTELFRQTTNEPGWMMASTQTSNSGSTTYLQPTAVRQNNGGTNALLLHEFLHVLVEQQAGPKAPLWLREGLVETFTATPNPTLAHLPPSKVDAMLAHPASAEESRQAHELAGQMTSLLRAHYDLGAMQSFLRNGVPPEVAASLLK